jgi:hypothetical protein
MKTLRRLATEMALDVLVENLTRVMNIIGARSCVPSPATPSEANRGGRGGDGELHHKAAAILGGGA